MDSPGTSTQSNSVLLENHLPVNTVVISLNAIKINQNTLS